MPRASKSKPPKNQACDKFQLIADKLLQLMEEGNLPWHNPWSTTPYANAISGHGYSGLNPLLAQVDVMASGYSTTLFAGYAQAKEKGWTIRRGSKATWLRWGGTVCKQEEGDDGEVSETFFRTLKWLQVFNLDCFDDSKSNTKIADVAARFKGPQNLEPRIEEAEQLIAAQGAVIQFGGDRACYSPSGDRIQMPHYSDFSSPQFYYATAIHELTHWTGHYSRLNRAIQNSFGTQSYAFEELVAELGAAFVCNELGIVPELEHHASYLEGWISILKSDNRAFFKASALAQKAAMLLLEKAGMVTATSEAA